MKPIHRELPDFEVAPADGQMETYPERVRRTIATRVLIADNAATVLVPHDEVTAASRARLIAKLSGKGDA